MYQDTAEQAQAIHDRLANSHAGIRGLRNLSDKGRQARHAKAQVAAQTKLDTLRAQHGQAAADRRARLERDLHGIGSKDPSAVISYRDARDRANTSKTPSDALRLLKQAAVTGDETLAKGVAADAADRGLGWEPVLDTYVSTRPDAAAALDELRSIDGAAGSGMNRLHSDALFNAPLPPELRHVPRHMLGQLAKEADAGEAG